MFFSSVSDWSDEKLQRMLEKNIRASNDAFSALKLDKFDAYQKTIKEIKGEIENRKQRRDEHLGKVMAPLVQNNLQKMLEVVQKLMQEKGIPYEDALVLSKTMQEEAAKMYIAQGMPQDQAEAASMKEVFNIVS